MGPLNGYTVIEMAGLGPAPMAGMILADMGAEVIRVERSAHRASTQAKDVSYRGKKSVVINLRTDAGRKVMLSLIERADVLLEGFRPGVMEKLGLDPDTCWSHNPKLVFGRMTGWGQDGPLAKAPGHDINYIALTGALHACGNPGEKPIVPLNLIGDMGGGGMLLVTGVLAALLEASRSGKGQVVDAAMVDGAAQLMWLFHGLHAMGMWNAEERGVNLLDGGAHFYNTYETADGKYICVGAIEPQFYGSLLELAGIDADSFPPQMDQAGWPVSTQKLAEIFRSRTRDEWCQLLEGSDACFAPVLSLAEAPQHPHNVARGSYIEVDGFIQPAPAPRFSRTPSQVRHGQQEPGQHTDALLATLGYSPQEIERLRKEGAVQ